MSSVYCKGPRKCNSEVLHRGRQEAAVLLLLLLRAHVPCTACAVLRPTHPPACSARPPARCCRQCAAQSAAAGSSGRSCRQDGGRRGGGERRFRSAAQPGNTHQQRTQAACCRAQTSRLPAPFCALPQALLSHATPPSCVCHPNHTTHRMFGLSPTATPSLSSSWPSSSALSPVAFQMWSASAPSSNWIRSLSLKACGGLG